MTKKVRDDKKRSGRNPAFLFLPILSRLGGVLMAFFATPI